MGTVVVEGQYFHFGRRLDISTMRSKLSIMIIQAEILKIDSITC